MKSKNTYIFEMHTTEQAKAFSARAGVGFDPEVFGEIIRDTSGRETTRVQIHGSDSTLYDGVLLKELRKRAEKLHGILVSKNGKPVHPDGTPW